MHHLALTNLQGQLITLASCSAKPAYGSHPRCSNSFQKSGGGRFAESTRLEREDMAPQRRAKILAAQSRAAWRRWLDSDQAASRLWAWQRARA